MEIKEQSGLRQVLAGTPLPKMCKVRQIFKRDSIEDVPAYLQKKLDDPKLRARIKPGMRVVLTGSSRQIANMSVILRKLAQFVKEQGAQPYIIPAMGSHGGATDEGQRQILESYGITEEFCGCPIFSSMETVRVGELPNGDEVRVDKFAHDADAVIVVGRIKAHTAFRGPYESGLIKMMAIGMGKRAGADSLHSAGFGEMGERLPMVSENDELPDERKAVTEYAQKLQTEIFPDLKVAFVHGKMKAKEKDAVMSAFASGESDILVSTTVIEVGVDVPNANLMVVENAERFGLSQLHQLRGRVGRGAHQSYCVLVSDNKNDETRQRLKAMTKTADGFKIAEEDLRLRGPGDFFGLRQHGLPGLRVADLGCDTRLLAEAQSAADGLLAEDPALTHHPATAERVRKLFQQSENSLN